MTEAADCTGTGVHKDRIALSIEHRPGARVAFPSGEVFRDPGFSGQTAGLYRPGPASTLSRADRPKTAFIFPLLGSRMTFAYSARFKRWSTTVPGFAFALRSISVSSHIKEFSALAVLYSGATP